jgi:Mrp family chromosome partitioning ATPase
VLLVDLDLWRPSLAATVHRLAATPTIQEIDGSPVLRDEATGLELLPITGMAGGTSRSAAFARRLAEVCRRTSGHDVIVLDAPPIVPVPDVLAAAAQADATLLLVRFEHTRAEAVRAALTRLASVGARPLGTVLTRVVRRNYRRYGHRTEVLPLRSD